MGRGVLPDTMSAARAEASAATVVERWVAAFNDGDLESALELAHPALSFRPLRVHGTSTWRGHAGLRGLWQRIDAEGLRHRVELESVHATAGGELLALGSVQPGGLAFAGIYVLEGGLVRDGRHYFSREGLLEQLGILAT